MIGKVSLDDCYPVKNLSVDISIDTQRSTVAAEVLSLGATCINDVSALRDPAIARAVLKLENAGFIYSNTPMLASGMVTKPT
jgi:dihydropteroate synthase